jgi:RNA polymerase sigma-70 factor (ECF subfamily)
MVQETFLAALKGWASFAGRSAEKSWLVGILKNKICDHFRKASRETSFTDMEFYCDEESDRFIPDGLFQGGWIHELGPLEWSSDPGASLDSQAFWKTSTIVPTRCQRTSLPCLRCVKWTAWRARKSASC